MTETAKRDSPRRIVLALDSPRECSAVLEAAVELAQQLRAELHGLFVEDVDLLRLVGLPFAKQVLTPSGSARELSEAALERTLRAQAEDARQGLRTRAEQARVHWSFQVVRGRVGTALLSESTATDVIIVGRGRELRFQRLVTRLAPRVRAERVPAPVLVAYDGTETAARALAVAAGLAQAAKRPLAVLLVASTAGAAQTLRDSADVVLSGLGIATVSYRAVPDADASTLANAARGASAARVVLGVTEESGIDKRLERLSREVNCPVVLVR